MMDAGRHPNIELLSYSEVVEVHGYVGNFQVKVKRKARYVDEEKCTGCGDCMEACVWQDRVYSEYEAGMGLRSAAYIPFAQAVPMKAVIDPNSCLLHDAGQVRPKVRQGMRGRTPSTLTRKTNTWTSRWGPLCWPLDMT